MLRFRSQFEDSWTEVSAEGIDACSAINILAASLVRRGDEVEIEMDDEWHPVEASE